MQGDKRKLQTEIDRTLKKVQEGVEVFDAIWEKVGARCVSRISGRDFINICSRLVLRFALESLGAAL